MIDKKFFVVWQQGGAHLYLSQLETWKAQIWYDDTSWSKLSFPLTVVKEIFVAMATTENF